MSTDPEILTINRIIRMLDKHDPPSRERIMEYVFLRAKDAAREHQLHELEKAQLQLPQNGNVNVRKQS